MNHRSGVLSDYCVEQINLGDIPFIMKKSGICKLTGKTGVFVRSHILPRALTRPSVAGAPLIQAGQGKPPTKRWDSWYDHQLVIRAGEDVLSDIDNEAIIYLRQQKLIWSGIKGDVLEETYYTSIPSTPWGIRKFNQYNSNCLRLFFLSLLWRATSTHLPEFLEAKIPDEDRDRIGTQLINRDPGDPYFYPIELIQIATKGEQHNLTPIRQEKSIPLLENDKKIEIIRFYMDGLIAHIHVRPFDLPFVESVGNFIVGAAAELVCTTVTYEASWQSLNLTMLRTEWLDTFD